MTITLPKGGKASFRLSEQYKIHKGTFETTESLTPKKAQSVHTTTNFEEKKVFYKPAQSTKTCHVSFLLFSETSPMTLSSPNTHPSFLEKVHCHMAAQCHSPELPISSRKSATTSLDQSCRMTSMARHSLLCSYSSPSPEVTLAEHVP